MEPTHLHINKDITDVLFNSAKYKFSSKFSIDAVFQSHHNESDRAKMQQKSKSYIILLLGIHRVGHLVESLRVVKSSAEISLLQKCTSITAKGFTKVSRLPCMDYLHIYRNNLRLDRMENSGFFLKL